MKKTIGLKNIQLVGGILGCLSFGALCNNAVAADSGVTFSPMIGKYFPDDEKGLEDGNFLSLGLGYDFENNWGSEFTFLRSKADIENSDQEVDLDVLRLDALYHFADGGIRPYVVGGVGWADFDSPVGIDERERMANLGLGVKFMVTKAFSLRADARVMQGLEHGQTDYLAGLGAIFTFGQSAPVKKAKPTPEPKPAMGPIDTDGDGVADGQDSCPGTAAGIVVDSKGCELDSDGDGVVNSADKCPDSEAGAKVDETGCYVVLKEEVSVSLNVNFATNSADVVSASNPDIRKVAEFLRSYPLTNVVIEGHTDSSGAAAYNKDLSQRRAQSVADILVNDYQINSGRVSAVGYGEEQPLVDNSTAENRAKNRRVTAVVKAVAEKIVK